MFTLLKLPFSAWNKFWFRCESTSPLGIFRIVFGIFILVIIVISYPNWERFYGPQGSLPLSSLGESWSWSIFALTDIEWFVWGVFWVSIVAAVTFLIGFWTRLATIVLFIIFVSMLHRNINLINGQDQVAAMLLFFSIFAPLGDSFSVDALVRHRRHARVSAEPFVQKLKPIWSLRLMQISVALIYLFSTPAKYLGDIAWRDGSALYYVSLSDRWFRFPDIYFLHNTSLSMVLTFSTLIIQLAFALFVWFSKTRPFVLIGIIFLHFSLLIFMAPSIFFFNAVLLVSFILFVPPETIEHLLKYLSEKLLRLRTAMRRDVL